MQSNHSSSPCQNKRGHCKYWNDLFFQGNIVGLNQNSFPMIQPNPTQNAMLDTRLLINLQQPTVTILMQHLRKFFGKFITGPYWNAYLMT